MAAITATNTLLTEFSGDNKTLILSGTLGSASDTMTLTLASHGITNITAVTGAIIKTGYASTFAGLQVSFSGLVITIASFAAAGSAATTFGTVTITVVGN